MKLLYNKAKEAKVGDRIKCPGCEKHTIKTTYNKTFCSNAKTRGNNCKDRFWNKVDPEKRCRKTPFFYDVILPNIAKEQGFPDVETMKNHVDDYDGSWDAHGCHVANCEYCGMRPEYCDCD